MTTQFLQMNFIFNKCIPDTTLFLSIIAVLSQQITDPLTHIITKFMDVYYCSVKTTTFPWCFAHELFMIVDG